MSGAMIFRSQCVNDTLDQLQTILDTTADRRLFARVADRLPAQTLAWDEDAWHAAQSSGALINGGDDLTLAWSGPYTVVNLLNATQNRFMESRVRLTSWTNRPGPMSALEQDRAIQAIGETRQANIILTRGGAAQMMAIRDAGVTINPKDLKANYEDARAQWGDCAIDAGTVDLTTLRSRESRNVNPLAGGAALKPVEPRSR